MVAGMKLSGIGGGFEYQVILESWASGVLVDLVLKSGHGGSVIRKFFAILSCCLLNGVKILREKNFRVWLTF